MRPRTLRLAGVLLLLAACGGSEPTSVAGNLTAAFFQGNSNAGAVLITISGGPVESVTGLGGSGQQVSFASAGSGTTRVVVLGGVQNGDLFRFRVPDVGQATSYTARIDQVADQATFSLLDPAAYTLTIHK